MQRYRSINSDLAHRTTPKRRVQRACDLCRRKKTRCDGNRLPGKQCSNCTAANLICAYLDANTPILSQHYVEDLEKKVDEMEKLLREMLPPGADLAEELEKETIAMPASDSDAGSSIPNVMRSLCRDTTNEKGRSVSEDDYDDVLESNLRRFQSFTQGRFFGKSSHAQFIQTALDVKYGRPTYVCDPSNLPLRRPEFWEPLTWHTPSRFSQVQIDVEYDFPDNNLLWSLIDLYFSESNIFLPVLHRPSFERLVAESAHLHDSPFARVLLAVCAIASRYSTDSRVLIENDPSSSGWKWMQQILVCGRENALLGPPLLYHCQSACLIAEFMKGCSIPQAGWTIVGVALRVAQEAGVHRKRTHEGPNNAEAESWRRVFWCLVCIDRYVSSALGRPCAANDEDIDTDLPADCDDEYWPDHVDLEQAFKQPKGQPSLISYFNCHIRLTRLLTLCLRTLHGINKWKAIFGVVEKNWEEQIVAELDSALNTWIDTLPDHLQWDPNRENFIHFKQSAALLGAYYDLRMLIHRPFITTRCHSSKWPFPSLTICTDAAHSCSHIVDIQHQRGGKSPFAGYLAFNAALVLLFNIWNRQQSGISVDVKKEMDDVHKCMRILHSLESKWRFAGVYWDVLYQLTAAGDLPLPSPVSRNKRERDSDYPFDPNERGRSDVEKDSYAVGNSYGGSSYPPTNEPMNLYYAPAPPEAPSSQWGTTSILLSTQDPQWDYQSTSASSYSQWTRSPACSLSVNSNNSERVYLHGQDGQAAFSHDVPEQDPQIYGYREPSSSCPPRQEYNPGYMSYYRCDGDLGRTRVFHSGESDDDRNCDRMRTLWGSIPRRMELSDWDRCLRNPNELPWSTQ
ncbi:fungal-specific transcription factor domain-containing protein [Desarmillaria tabescens]|uniref:Fungal-specific transcription factor domain-containing protein n=1 Tax=Armillaria tabescens TaxID=1929756 RepID=A0AA39NJQ9_ARMTA|nr:fungal-specific transcription factor domain-containing protein [Desarmillaria tabescens]KAK0466862.1 fungal-specific transcription factor domain-containing protein [Desarmillaria tabescens]